ncbi:CPBP family intramembrane metalloprotease [Lactiplantibacillus pentosus]|nr:CPBP family intramembrane metalloprotease [Lactiplantibacillus plantarum]MBU7462637.1 CPBP family intramembrane metalloprotease [Lactiplantibacillus pentosus]MBU7485312.1 CPBP family intramembrane metalloprotease [Lactiplantibacillus sp. 30.2.29]MBU7488538.1 CPBP family intramembrane metalloprotease [Lactiplantibacillus pentosus]MBU7501616.1 CPBP family intramembrane metalloprotease [Lactiplantibacillus pentosus]
MEMSLMRSKELMLRLFLVVFFEVLFELLIINLLRGWGEYNSLVFLFLDKCLFFSVLVILNATLTQQKIPFSIKLHKEQRELIFTLAIILIIIGLVNKKNLLSAFIIGLIGSTTEEYLFRGIILVTLFKLFQNSKNQLSRILFPLMISSVLFGLEHFLNLYSQSLLLTVVQVCQTMAMGFLFACIFIRTRNLLFPTVCHFCIDFVVTAFWGMQNSNSVSFESTIVIIVLYLIVGFAILIPTLTDSNPLVKK